MRSQPQLSNDKYIMIGSDTFRSVLIYGKEQGSRKKTYHNRAEELSAGEDLTVEARFFLYREI